MPQWLNKESAGCLQSGDIIETPVKIPATDFNFPMFNHYGIVIYVCGVPYVCHLPGRTDPILESLEKFEEKRKIVRVLRNEQTENLTNEHLFNNFNQIANKKYYFWRYNCEDFIKAMTGGTVDLGFDQRCGYGLLILVILGLIFLLYLMRKK